MACTKYGCMTGLFASNALVLFEPGIVFTGSDMIWQCIPKCCASN